MDGGEGSVDVTAPEDRDKASHRRPGSIARIGHDPDAFASFYREYVTAVTRLGGIAPLTPRNRPGDDNK